MITIKTRDPDVLEQVKMQMEILQRDRERTGIDVLETRPAVIEQQWRGFSIAINGGRFRVCQWEYTPHTGDLLLTGYTER